jgi:hypothetical protein
LTAAVLVVGDEFMTGEVRGNPRVAPLKAETVTLAHPGFVKPVGALPQLKALTHSSKPQVREASSRVISSLLRQSGVPLRQIMVIENNVDVIAFMLRRLSPVHRYIFVTGGIGPRHTDVCVVRVDGWVGGWVSMLVGVHRSSPGTWLAKQSVLYMLDCMLRCSVCSMVCRGVTHHRILSANVRALYIHIRVCV